VASVYAARVMERAEWDVAVIGAGPAGLAAASAAAAAGARTIVFERAEHPRYKTCGGGLIGASLAAVGQEVHWPARDRIDTATFTLDGQRPFTRQHTEPILAMVLREEFDDALRLRAVGLGATLRQRCTVRAIEAEADGARVRLADGTTVSAQVVVGADGSSGVSARHVGVEFSQVDLGLEVEVKATAGVQRQWRGRVLLDWGQLPGSYGWVFPKDDRLTVGVIAARGQGSGTKEYLRAFIDRLKLGSCEVIRDSGHLTRCRTSGSDLRKGRVLVAGDAAGLLEPWTREGISFALRSGALAGACAAKAATQEDGEQQDGWLAEYVASVHRDLIPDMDAGRRILAAFSRHPGAFHAVLATPKGWRAFVKICRSELSFSAAIDRRSARAALSFLARA
jgi:geranylgeranyl reductase family protein